jgi:hypothetical protein
MKMKTLATPIVMQNLTKWKVSKCVDNKDDDIPNAHVTIQVQGSGGIVYGIFTLVVYNDQNSDVLTVNILSQGYGDKITAGKSQLTGAYTTTAAANGGAGNRNAQLAAVEAACLATGLVAASLAGT